MKLLVWERNGFIVWYQRLEKDKLLDGCDVWRMKPHEALHFSVFS